MIKDFNALLELFGLGSKAVPEAAPRSRLREYQQKQFDKATALNIDDILEDTSPPLPERKPVPKPLEVELAEKIAALGITDRMAQAGILAQLKAESRLTTDPESMRYSPQRLYSVFPSYFKDVEEAADLIRQGQEAVANRVYGGRMGNAPDEGYRYRGKGYIQLTGKDNYKRYGDILGVDLVNSPDLLVDDPDISLRLAVEYLKDRSKDLTSAYENTKGVAPAGWRNKVAQREQYQYDILKILSDFYGEDIHVDGAPRPGRKPSRSGT